MLKKSFIAIVLILAMFQMISYANAPNDKNPLSLILEKLESISKDIIEIKEELKEDDNTIPGTVSSIDFEDWLYSVDASSVIGTWDAVSFVDKPSMFDPNEFSNDLFLKQIVFNSEEAVFYSEKSPVDGFVMSWQDNAIIHPGGDRTVSRFLIKEINGVDYMFLEWKSGDYINNGSVLKYYVLKRL